MKEEFLQKLKALMEEYRVSIGFSVGDCSDTHGLYDEKMVITHRIHPNEWGEEDWLTVDGWDFSSRDIGESK